MIARRIVKRPFLKAAGVFTAILMSCSVIQAVVAVPSLIVASTASSVIYLYILWPRLSQQKPKEHDQRLACRVFVASQDCYQRTTPTVCLRRAWSAPAPLLSARLARSWPPLTSSGATRATPCTRDSLTRIPARGTTEPPTTPTLRLQPRTLMLAAKTPMQPS